MEQVRSLLFVGMLGLALACGDDSHGDAETDGGMTTGGGDGGAGTGGTDGGTATGGTATGGADGGTATGGSATGGTDGGTATGGSATGGTDGGTATGGADGGTGTGGNDGGTPSGLCPVTLEFTPPTGVTAVRVPGEWQGFDFDAATAMIGPDALGAYQVTLELAPGLQAYDIAYEEPGSAPVRTLDPKQGRRKYVAGIEHSAVKVPDCSLPALSVATSEVTRPMADQGTFTASLTYVDGAGASGADAAGFEATLLAAGTTRGLTAQEFTVSAAGNVSITLTGLSDGKYRVTLTPRSKSGLSGKPLRLPFWVEAEPFSFQDALIYRVVTDRFRDGEPTNNPAPTPNVDPRTDWFGGDLAGLTLAIQEGVLSTLGVNVLWLTSTQENASGAFLANDGVHLTTAYHGYWPVKAREVDARLGGAQALHALVQAAHAQGMRIIQDQPMNDVHADHEYVASHPDWFRESCVCGEANCDWTAMALECRFADYLLDVDHTVAEADAQFVADAVDMLDVYDLDGLHVDAVKHLELAAVRNLTTEVREAFEGAGTDYYLAGTTAVGFADCADPCNDANYGAVLAALGPFGFDGQLDMVLYHGVSTRTFAYADTGMQQADYWAQHNLSKWPSEAVMIPYIGQQDTPRFVTLADYADRDRSIPTNSWTNIALEPTVATPYERTRLALAWLLAQPGAPLLYYGDEYGQWGGAVPNNRPMWKPSADLQLEELQTLAFTQRLGTARTSIPALRRGAYVPLLATDDTLVIGRKIPGGSAALVALTRQATPATPSIDLTPLGFAPGTVLHDAMGGPDVAVANAAPTPITIPALSAVVLSP